MERENLVVIRNSAISGKGTFAQEKIPKGRYIFTLQGEAFNLKDYEAFCKDRNFKRLDDPLQINDDTILILDYASNTINHSCQPNAGVRTASDLYALKDIEIGEEITFDYSTTVPVEDPWRMSCFCGHANCRKEIGHVLTIAEDRLSSYIELDLLPLYIKRQLGALLRSSR